MKKLKRRFRKIFFVNQGSATGRSSDKIFYQTKFFSESKKKQVLKTRVEPNPRPKTQIFKFSTLI